MLQLWIIPPGLFCQAGYRQRPFSYKMVNLLIKAIKITSCFIYIARKKSIKTLKLGEESNFSLACFHLPLPQVRSKHSLIANSFQSSPGGSKAAMLLYNVMISLRVIWSFHRRTINRFWPLPSRWSGEKLPYWSCTSKIPSTRPPLPPLLPNLPSKSPGPPSLPLLPFGVQPPDQSQKHIVEDSVVVWSVEFDIAIGRCGGSLPPSWVPFT